MSIKVPIANTNRVMTRNLVKQMASDGFLPVIALEAFCRGRKNLSGIQRGGFDEAREELPKNFQAQCSGWAEFQLLMHCLKKSEQKILKLPNKSVDIASDDVRKPLGNFLEHERTKDGARILESKMAKFKFVKVISSVLIANAFIGFVLPKINQAITRSYHKNKDVNNTHDGNIVQYQNPTFDNFYKKR